MTTDPEFQTPAERRLGEHLREVREERPASDESITRSVFQTLRWQRALIIPLRAGAAVAAGLMEGIKTLLGAERSS